MKDLDKYSSNGLKSITSSSMLDTKDHSTIISMKNQLQDTYTKKQVWRTTTEMKVSVLDNFKFPTTASKYWQSIREQDVFYTNLIYLSCEYEEKQGELELLQIEYDEIKDDNKKSGNQKIIKSKIKRAEFTLIEMRLQAHHRVREIESWEEIKKELVKIDPNFDTTDPDTHQMDSYEQRFAKQLDSANYSEMPSRVYQNLTGSIEAIKDENTKKRKLE